MSAMTLALNESSTQSRAPERPRFYARQIVTADDLNLAQDYFRNRQRRHNRMLHGFGVVCGAELVESSQPWYVTINPGYLLSPFGDEICIEKKVDFDVRTLCDTPSETTTPDPCGCSENTDTSTELPGTLYIAVRYLEVKSRPVNAPGCGCGCGDNSCEYSRWKDWYQVCTLQECPESHQNPPVFGDLFQGPAPSCTSCPADAWVVLGSVQVQKNNSIAVNGGCTCRRQVASFGGFWWNCSDNKR